VWCIECYNETACAVCLTDCPIQGMANKHAKKRSFAYCLPTEQLTYDGPISARYDTRQLPASWSDAGVCAIARRCQTQGHCLTAAPLPAKTLPTERGLARVVDRPRFQSQCAAREVPVFLRKWQRGNSLGLVTLGDTALALLADITGIQHRNNARHHVRDFGLSSSRGVQAQLQTSAISSSLWRFLRRDVVAKQREN